MTIKSLTKETLKEINDIRADAWEIKLGRKKRPEDITMYGDGEIVPTEDGKFELKLDTENVNYTPLRKVYADAMVDVVEEIAVEG